jgi:hypothetical protein
MFFSNRDEIKKSCWRPSIYATCKISLYFAKKMRRFFRVFTDFRLLTDFVCLYNYEFWLSLCKIARSSVILLLPLSTRYNNYLWRTIFLTDQDERRYHYRGPSINVFYQVSVHFAKRCQKRRILDIDQPETRISYGDHAC